MSTRREIGMRMETEASAWLLKRGRRRILIRNYTARQGEIDLILEERCQTGEVELVFVEIRMRTRGLAWVSGLESVDWKKRARIEMTARRFLSTYTGPAAGIRFDVLDWDGTEWTHYQAAWTP